VIHPDKLLVLPHSNHPEMTAASRLWIIEHAISIGAKRRWQLDDNIAGFYRFNRNAVAQVADCAIFCAAEDFEVRHENLGITAFSFKGGFLTAHYRDCEDDFFAAAREIAAVRLNTSAPCCLLVDHNMPVRWEGASFDDVDIALRLLKSGWCTARIDAFLHDKATTGTIKGGCSTHYDGAGRLKCCEMLRARHPEAVTITHKFGRVQPYARFGLYKDCAVSKQRADAFVAHGVNEYGMRLEEVTK
jgi:hypothetical protein